MSNRPQRSKDSAGDKRERQIAEEAARWEDRLSDPYNLGQHPCCRKTHQGTKVQKGNCLANPNCLFGLGEFKRGIWSPPNLGPDPSLDFRAETERSVGLKNLGATCYLNSLLQCLFMNEQFRNAVYAWTTAEDAGGSGVKKEAAASPKTKAAAVYMTELQRVFAHMQLSNRRFYDPKAFVEVMQLKMSYQQEAQEFNKLMMTHMDEIFKSDSREKYRTLVGAVTDSIDRRTWHPC